MYKNPNKFIQFQLWHDCNNGCIFCCNKGQPKTDKVAALKRILELLDNPATCEGFNEIGIIGGEIFDNQLEDPEVMMLFYKLIDKIISMPFDRIYIATTLIYNMNKYLIPLLCYLNAKRALDRCWICTSYDLKYRFKSEEAKRLWHDNMAHLTKYCPNVFKHVEMIVTQYFVDAVNSGEFDIDKFADDYNVKIDFIEPSSGLGFVGKKECEEKVPGFFPTKASFTKFLYNIKDSKSVDINTMFSMELRSEDLYFFFNNEYMSMKERRSTDGRCTLDPTKKYEIGFIDSDTTMSSVVKGFRELLGD